MLAAGAQAGIITLSGPISGANENPQTGSPGTGFASVLLDNALHTLTVDANFGNLFPTIPNTSTPSGTTAAHIHCCVAPPGNAGVATTTPSFIGFPLGVTSGTFHTVLNLLDPASYNPAFITMNGGNVAAADIVFENNLTDGQTYFNIHTNAFLGGEVRAFLLTPEPTTAALTLSAAVALWLLRRKR
jgi:hypothetical protein